MDRSAPDGLEPPLQRSVLDWYLEVSGWILHASPSEETPR